MTKLDANELCLKIKQVLLAAGLNEYSANSTAECMTMADSYGVKTHGSAVLPSHLKKIKGGGYELNPKFSVLQQTPAFASIDAQNAIGFASATFCMNMAIERCKAVGVYTVFCRHANTYGAAFCYPMMAAQKNLIGFTCCNTPSAMAPIGGKEKMLGTNPFSIVLPTSTQQIILDMATSKVAKSRFLQAKRNGEKLPEGWATDVNGQPTTDPDEAIRGLVLPMDGFKGYGLALAIDYIAGLLSGAAFLNGVGRFYSATNDAMNVGHVFVAIDPSLVLGAEWMRQTEAYVGLLRNSQPIEGATVCIPGDDKLKAFHNTQENGIEIIDEVNEIFQQI